ncbi:MAG: hypothetical protein AAF567_17330 [Actinomycetota bacterium]
MAAFRDGSLKVGTSTHGRSDTRLAEQGAWAAQFVAECDDGLAVRRLEDAATERLDLAQAVQASRKLAGLVHPRADDALDAELAETAERVGVLVDERADPAARRLLDEPMWRHPKRCDALETPPIRYPAKLTTGRHDLAIRSAIGRLLLVTRGPSADPGGGASPGDVFAIDPAPLFGRVLDMGEYGSEEIAIQDSLF